MRIGDTFKKAAGLFVEIDETDPESDKPWSVMDAPATAPAPAPVAPATAKTVEQIVREQPGPNLDEIKAPATPTTPVIDAQGNVNFKSIYELAGLPPATFSAEQVLELLASLPAELPLESRRATVKVTLSAVGQTTGANAETIVTDASRKLAALASYAKSYSEQADEYVHKAGIEIAALEQQIAQRKQSIEEAKQKQASMMAACTAESDRLDDVLEFFSLDVGPSKYAAPK